MNELFPSASRGLPLECAARQLVGQLGVCRNERIEILESTTARAIYTAPMLEIRKAERSDFDDLWPIIEPVVRSGETYPYATNTDRSTAFHLWMELPAATYIALEDGAAVGTYYLKPNQPALGSHVCNAGYMVQAQARGRGIGRALCLHSIAEAHRLGYKAMQFNLVVCTNTGAIRLYRRLGFEVVGRLHKAFDHAREGLVDALVMYKWLGPD